MFWNQELWGLQLCSLFKIDLAIQGPLRFHVNFGMVLLVWKCLWGFDRDNTESSDCFGEYGDFNNKSSNPPTQGGFPFICLLWFLVAVFCSSQCTNLSIPWLSISPSVLFFRMLLSVRLLSLTFCFAVAAAVTVVEHFLRWGGGGEAPWRCGPPLPQHPSLKSNRYIHTWNYHNTANQLQSNIKAKKKKEGFLGGPVAKTLLPM